LEKELTRVNKVSEVVNHVAKLASWKFPMFLNLVASPLETYQ